ANHSDIWEFQHLRNAAFLLKYNEQMATPMMPKLGMKDLIPYFGDAILQFASKSIKAQQRLILKEPSVKNIRLFFEFFPRSFLILLIRDGRDYACSAMKTKFAGPPRPNMRSLSSYKTFLQNP